VDGRQIDRSTPDGASRISFIDRSLMFQNDGRIVSWDVFAGRAGQQRLQVWRPDIKPLWLSYNEAFHTSY
jgi:hypothetical protein